MPKPPPLTEHSKAILAKVAAILKEHNPCQIRMVEREQVNWATMRSHKVRDLVCSGGSPCCTDCKHLGPNGCTVSAPACRFWLCSHLVRTFALEVRIELATLLMEYDQPLHWRHDQHEVSKNAVMRNILSSDDLPLLVQLLNQRKS